MEKQLNQILADLVVEYHKLQNFHWYVKGHGFFTMHAALEAYYEDMRADIDEIAECLLQINHEPKATLKEYLEIASIAEAEGKFRGADEILKEVHKDFDHLLGEIRTLKRGAEEKGLKRVDILADKLLEKYSKKVWMLRQSQM